MNSDDREFFSRISKGSSTNSDIFITIKPKSQLSFTGDIKIPDQLKGFLPSSYKVRTAAIFRVSSLHCDILYASTVRLAIEETVEYANWTEHPPEYYDKQKKQFAKILEKRLDDTLRFYIKVMKDYCSKTDKEGLDEKLKRYNALDARYKICDALSYIEGCKSGLGLISGNAHIDALQLLLKAHKVIGPYFIVAYDEKYPAPNVEAKIKKWKEDIKAIYGKKKT